MKNTDHVKASNAALQEGSACWSNEESHIIHERMRGRVFVQVEGQEPRVIKNLIVRDAGILLARLAKASTEPDHGIFMLAVGTGDVGWNPLAPPAATATQRSLYTEISRRPFTQTDFIDASGAVSAIPTNIVDFTALFGPSDAVGPLVEMGLIAGDVVNNVFTQNPILPANGPYDPSVDVRGKDLLFNYTTFPVINKPAGLSMTLTWRITF